MDPTFTEIWNIFSTGKGRVFVYDANSLTGAFDIAERELLGQNCQKDRQSFLRFEKGTHEQMEAIISEIKKNTVFNGTVVFNTDGRRRYENLAIVGFILTEEGPQTIVLTQSGIELANKEPKNAN